MTEDLLVHWNMGRVKQVTPFGSGLINSTWKVLNEEGEQFVLQRLHPIFKPLVNEDIEVITSYLKRQGFLTPLLLRTKEGRLWVEAEKGVYRMLTFVEGEAFDALSNVRQAHSAGKLVGRFHTALLDLKYQYQFTRPYVHHTDHFVDSLQKALSQGVHHPFYSKVAYLNEHLQKAFRQLPNLWLLPRRHTHGDLKISNLLFNQEETAICLVDLDTLSLSTLPIEMGDAFRSWCNPFKEDAGKAVWKEDFFQAGIEGYAEETHSWITSEEKSLLVEGVKVIALELTARYLIDTLEEKYFSWDATKYKNRAEHNWIRAKGQWELFMDICSKEIGLYPLVERAYQRCSR